MSNSQQDFMEITGAVSSEAALYYLELCDQDLNAAVNLYFEDNRPAKSTSKATPTEEPPPSKLAKHEADETIKPANQMWVLQWNVQGLLDTRLRERTVETAKEISKLQPDVVMMQEVILDTLRYFESALSDHYILFSPSDFTNSSGCFYFTTLMVRKSTFNVKAKKLIRFGSSRQGRDLIVVSGICCGKKVTVMTSHLESTRPSAPLRIQQLIKTSEIMKNEPSSHTVIFAGDTNLRDSEVVEAKSKNDVLSTDIDDVWEKLGSPANARFSWDCERNDNQLKGSHARLRFGRVYMRKAPDDSESHFQAKSMKFVGTKRLPCGMFASDHWGIFVTFELPDQLKKES